MIVQEHNNTSTKRKLYNSLIAWLLIISISYLSILLNMLIFETNSKINPSIIEILKFIFIALIPPFSILSLIDSDYGKIILLLSFPCFAILKIYIWDFFRKINNKFCNIVIFKLVSFYIIFLLYSLNISLHNYKSVIAIFAFLVTFLIVLINFIEDNGGLKSNKIYQEIIDLVLAFAITFIIFILDKVDKFIMDNEENNIFLNSGFNLSINLSIFIINTGIVAGFLYFMNSRFNKKK